FEELRVLDIKFVYGCPRPTIVVLYQDAEDVRHMKTYKVALKDECFAEGPWSQNSLDNGAEFYGDSQMIKLNLPADAKGSHVEVLKRISPKSVHGWGPGVFKGWSPNMAFLSAIPNQVGNFAKFTTKSLKSLSAYFSSWNFYPGPAASAAPGDIISWSSNLSLPGPAAPGDTVSSSSNLSLPGPASATLDLSLWLDEMNELMLMVQHLRNGSRYYSVIYTKFSVFKPVLKDNFSSLSSLLVAKNCAPEPDYHVLTGCKAWMLMSSCGKSPEMDDAVFLWNPINDEIKTLPPFCSQPPFPSPIGSRI
ncbi:DNA damage-binding protein 1, partial [Striga asiatica]